MMNNGEKQLLPVKSDFVFKLIFGDQRNVDILEGFLKSVLNIPGQEYGRLTIVDPHLKKESADDKYGILDVKVHTATGRVIHIEVQLWFIPELKERCIYYQAKMLTEQMSSGQDYSRLRKVVSIIITDYELMPESKKYHNRFRYRSDDGLEFTDIAEINTLELCKLPPVSDNSELWYWMKFINSDCGEALDMLAQKSAQIGRAVGVLKELSADERTRMLFEEREKARRDIASMVGGARSEGRAEGRLEGRAEGRTEIARNMLRLNVPIEQIAVFTGLSKAVISQEAEALCNQ